MAVFVPVVIETALEGLPLFAVHVKLLVSSGWSKYDFVSVDAV